MKCLVVGHRGLIGSAISRELIQFAEEFVHEIGVRWASPNDAIVDIKRITDSFKGFVSKESWAVFWCAGKGFLGSIEGELEPEIEIFEQFLSDLSKWENKRGVVVLASSAGAIWNASGLDRIDENTPDIGVSPYALAKLRQEKSLNEFCLQTNIRGVVARISSVYGAGQDLHKQQGLISRMCIAAVTRTPISIFVPLETTRNYIFSTDLAKMLIQTAQTEVRKQDLVRGAKKVVLCSRDNHSIASICKAVEDVSRRKLLKSTHLLGNVAKYPLHFQLRPKNLATIAGCESTTLLAGVSVVYREILNQYQMGLISRSS